jgi:hypothetical protein
MLNMDEIGEAFVQTEAEYIVPIFGLQDTLAAANQAMDNKDTAEAQTFIDLATGFETQIEKTHRYLHQKWQCQFVIAALHDSRGRRQEALARFEKTFRSDGGRSRSYFDAANIEYAKMLQVVGFSKGYGSSDFSWRFDAYVQFLRTGGRSEEIPKIEALVKSLRQGGETPSGPNSAWPEVLNCAGAM